MQPQLSRVRSWALALTATLTLAVSYVDRQTFSVLAPTIQEQLHISDTTYGDWLAPAFSYAYLVSAPLAGYLIDKIGARRGLLGAVLLWSLVAALHALAPGFGALFALRIALGVAESPSFPGAAQTVQRALSPVDRARGFGFLFSGSSLGAMIAPLLATYLEKRFHDNPGFPGYKVAFLGTSLVGLSWVPLWLLTAYRRPARDVLDAVEPPKGFDPRGILTVAKSPVMLRGAMVIVASAPLLNLYYNWGAKYLVHDHRLTQHDVGKYLWFGPLVYDAGSILFGHLASRARARGYIGAPRELLLTAMVVMCAGALVPTMGAPLPAMLVASLSMAGGGGLYALATSDFMARIPASWVSRAGGLGATAQSLAYIVANPLIGRSVTYTKSYTQSFIVLVAWAVPLCVAWCFWRVPDAVEEQKEG